MHPPARFPAAFGTLAAWFCHQRPDRCFTIRGWTMPLCARCTGMYAGMLAAVAANLLVRKLVPSGRLAALCIAVVLIGGLEVLAEEAGWAGGNAVRLVSGLVMGAGVGTLLGVGLRMLILPPKPKHAGPT